LYRGCIVFSPPCYRFKEAMHPQLHAKILFLFKPETQHFSPRPKH
jgi:hypothetical protein